MENAVFLELKRRNIGEIYYHQGNNECDFLIRQGLKIVQAIQVCQSLQDKKTQAREYAGLLEAMQAHNLDSGLILVEDNEGTDTLILENKKFHVIIQPIWKWMIELK